MTSLSDRTVSVAERASGLSSRLAEHPRDEHPRDLQRVLLMMIDGAEITGLLHRTPGTRTLDYLNRQAEAFVAMTEATMRRADRTDEVPFIAINKLHILRVVEANLD